MKLYTKDGVYVYATSSRFSYIRSVSKITQGCYMLIDSRKIISRKPMVDKKPIYKYNPKTKVTIIEELELNSAPEQYLINNNFILVK